MKHPLPGEHSVWEMCNDPRKYAAESLQDMRNVMHLTGDEQQILGANFHRETGLVRTDLAGRRARVMNREYDRLTIHEVTRAQMYATAAKVIPPDRPTDEELRQDAEKGYASASWLGLLIVMGTMALMLMALIIASRHWGW